MSDSQIGKNVGAGSRFKKLEQKRSLKMWLRSPCS